MHILKPTLAVLFLLFGAQVASADECQIAIEGNDAMAFNTKEMSVPASCKEVTITLNHTGGLPANVMGHNWVLSQSDDFMPIANAGAKAGFDNNYLPPDDARIIAATKIVGGGESDSVTLSLEGLAADQEYTFFCSFPGHWSMMKGSFTIK